MTFQSVDKLQKALSDGVFHYAKDAKKAAGRALGTIVEIITYYIFEEWGLHKHISIETHLGEYGNPSLTHNVEFTLHKVISSHSFTIGKDILPLSIKKCIKLLGLSSIFSFTSIKTGNIIDKGGTIKNNAILGYTESKHPIISIINFIDNNISITIQELSQSSFAMVECKRVGVEEGMKKGPQTIEKAKQGAYVANSVSSLQKIRSKDGTLLGVFSTIDDQYIIEPYESLMKKVINDSLNIDYENFILTIGVASNHGNWFTSDNPNKELIVLAQSYDWLLFLTDQGLSKFIEDTVLEPSKKYKLLKEIFITSYSGKSGSNTFTKSKMSYQADILLKEYFRENKETIMGRFNIITPKIHTIQELQKHLKTLSHI